MKQTFHFCQSVDGALKNWNAKTWRENGKDNGMTGPQLKSIFKLYQHEGKRVLPIGKPCEGFSYETGCPGHEVK